MKKLLFSLLTVGALLGFQGCEEPNELIFTAAPDPDGIVFTNTLADVYLLSQSTADNVAERFVWQEVDLGVETNVTYDLYGATSEDFSDSVLVGSTTSNNLPVLVEQLLGFARDLGLDNDPNTTDANGNPNNTGVVYFRLKAYPGAGTGNAMLMFSPVQSLDIQWLEETVAGACDPIFVVGAAAVDAGWSWTSPIVFQCENNVFRAKIRLTNETFRFFRTEGDWASGLNYPYYEGEGYTIDADFENANDGDSNFRFTGAPGIYVLTVDDNNKTITLEPSGPLWLVGAATPGGWAWAAPTEAVETAVDVWEATLVFSNEAFRFFTVRDDWGSGRNFPYYAGEGYTIDANFENANDGDSNFRFIGTPGTYTITVNAVTKEITLQ